ncbi:DUF6088 family protein [Elusimicrobiota bacterium]
MRVKRTEKSTADKILARAIHRGRGSVFFGVELLDLGQSVAVRKALSRLVRTGIIRRIGTSLYHYPVINEKLGGELPPSADAVAWAIARRTDSRVMPSGALAVNLLGLSTQVPAKRVYLTSGLSRSIVVGSYTFAFRHVSPRRMAVRGKYSSMVFEALRYLKRGNVTDDVIARLRRTLPEKVKVELRRDLPHASVWMRPFVMRIIGEEG